MSAVGVSLGAPGVYLAPPERVRALTNVRMDVCAFVGVAPRGPAWAPIDDANPKSPLRRSVAVAVESFDEYARTFGRLEGAGLLPYAVASFFEQGGQRAYVVRVVPNEGAEHASLDATALGALGGLVGAGGHAPTLRARDEGTWGNALSTRVSFSRRPLALVSDAPGRFTPGGATVPDRGALLRIGKTLAFVDDVVWEWRGGRRVAVLAVAAAPSGDASADIVEATLDVDDGDGRVEQHTGLGLHPDHPRWIARVLRTESRLVRPAGDWEAGPLTTDASLRAVVSKGFTGGADRSGRITPDDCFDATYVAGDDPPFEGVHAVLEVDETALVVVPDLYSPWPLPRPIDLPVFAQPDFAPCLPAPAPVAPAPPDLLGLRLDPRADLDTIIRLQQRLADLADHARSFVVLLDVPPRLQPRQILHWRSSFDTAFAAAYHGWCNVVGDPATRSLVAVNPAAVAAGIIARREIERGIPFGPANEIARGVVDLLERVSPERLALFHQEGINVYAMERDGARLEAARTLSRDPDWRQLNVRRLVTMIERALYTEMQWAVFEPNDASLQRSVSVLLTGFLRRLHRANAFRGATEAESFFVRCGAEQNPPEAMGRGLFLCEVGVAPAEPLEFIVVRIQRDADGTLRVNG